MVLSRGVSKYRLECMSKEIELNGKTYSVSNLNQFLDTATTSQMRSYYSEVVNFITDWYADDKELLVHTSGSTGTPKELRIAKEKMVNSALLTCNYFNLKKGDSILLCMPLQYIAGKMMLVRAVVAQLAVWVRPPQGRPVKELNQHIDFAAMVPLQLYNSLSFKEDRANLKAIRQVLIGGGSIDRGVEEQLASFTNGFYSSYGMTETVSHIALRKVNGAERSEWYSPFPSVSLGQTDAGALTIDAPLVANEFLITNDVVEFNSRGDFKVLGRLDNIINSGGVKIQVEKVEEKLRNLIDTPYVVTARPDARLGEAVTLLIESQPYSTERLEQALLDALMPYEIPQSLFFVDKIPLTETKKISREKCKTIVLKLYNQKQN